MKITDVQPMAIKIPVEDTFGGKGSVVRQANEQE